jgi:ribosomal-protein-alanine N-acetyltransferase
MKLMKPKEVKAHIRWMIRRDMPEVLQIEQDSGGLWFEEDFLRCLRIRNCIGLVAEYGEHVIGFVIYELNKNSIRLVALRVSPEFQRRGVGHQFIARLIDKLSMHRRRCIVAEVPETNLDAQLFFKSQGLRAARVDREYFPSGEDAYVMVYCIGRGDQ